MSTFQLHLKGTGLSGRVVRYKTLSAGEVDQLTLDAAKSIGEAGTFLELRKAEWREGTRRMLVGVSEPVDTMEGVKVRKVQPVDLDGDNYDDLFTPRDHSVLVGLYRALHEVTQEEITAIMGKALPVSED